MALPSPGSIWHLAKKVERVLELDAKMEDALDGIVIRLNALVHRVTTLEVGKRDLINEARLAASAAAGVVASMHTSEISRQLGILQEQVRVLRMNDRPSGRRLGAPAKGDPDA